MPNSYDLVAVEGFPTETGLWLATLQNSTAKWKANLGRVDKNAVVWQQRPQGPSIGALILHLIESELYWLESFAAGNRFRSSDAKLLLSKETRQYGGKWPVPYPNPIDWYFELQEGYRIRAWDSIRNLEPDTLIERSGSTFSLRWIMAHVLQHDSYHGGQAVLLHEQYKAARQASRAKKPLV